MLLLCDHVTSMVDDVSLHIAQQTFFAFVRAEPCVEQSVYTLPCVETAAHQLDVPSPQCPSRGRTRVSVHAHVSPAVSSVTHFTYTCSWVNISRTSCATKSGSPYRGGPVQSRHVWTLAPSPRALSSYISKQTAVALSEPRPSTLAITTTHPRNSPFSINNPRYPARTNYNVRGGISKHERLRVRSSTVRSREGSCRRSWRRLHYTRCRPH